MIDYTQFSKYHVIDEGNVKKLIVKKCTTEDIAEYTAVVANVKTSSRLKVEGKFCKIIHYRFLVQAYGKNFFSYVTSETFISLFNISTFLSSSFYKFDFMYDYVMSIDSFQLSRHHLRLVPIHLKSIKQQKAMILMSS